MKYKSCCHTITSNYNATVRYSSYSGIKVSPTAEINWINFQFLNQPREWIQTTEILKQADFEFATTLPDPHSAHQPGAI